MLYCLWGSDRKAVSDQAKHLVEGLKKKRPNAEYFRLEADSSVSLLEQLLEASGLFEEKYIVLGDDLWKNPDMKDVLQDRAKDLADAPHVFILIGDAPDAATRKKLSAVAAKVVELDEEKEERDNSIFGWTEAVVQGRTVPAWLGLCDLKRKGHAPEAVMGALWWQLKSVGIAGKASSAAASGLSPFVYSKSKRLFETQGPKVDTLINRYLQTYSQLHQGMDPWLLIERMILENA